MKLDGGEELTSECFCLLILVVFIIYNRNPSFIMFFLLSVFFVFDSLLFSFLSFSSFTQNNNFLLVFRGERSILVF